MQGFRKQKNSLHRQKAVNDPKHIERNQLPNIKYIFTISQIQYLIMIY